MRIRVKRNKDYVMPEDLRWVFGTSRILLYDIIICSLGSTLGTEKEGTRGSAINILEVGSYPTEQKDSASHASSSGK